MSAPPAGGTNSQLSATTVVSTTVAGHECSTMSSPSEIGCSHDTPVTNALRTLHLNRSLSSIFRQNPRFLLSTTRYYEDRYPIHTSLQPERNDPQFPKAIKLHISTSATHQASRYYPAQSANQHCLVDPQHHAPHYHPTVRHPQVETVSHLGVPFEQQCSTSHQPSNQPPSHLQDTSSGFFNQAHDFIIKDSVFIDHSSDNFMALFLEATIIGAESDSSDRNTPLRCHPGTRSEIIKRCQDFILEREGRPRLRWVVGAAGVGKSAIMQSVAHDESDVLSGIIVGATIFFSINGGQDGTKAVTTIAYQLAVKLDPYRVFVQREVTRDPSLLQKSLSRQFDTFIVEPFVRRRILNCSSQVLIMLDGLDECAEPLIQQELLGLISDFCIAYPTSPIVWMVASRPEPHITSFFSQPKVAFSYEKEEILVDTDEACEDVKSYLRDKFREVQMASIPLQQLSRWPSKGDFLKIANASGGLFAYASTVVRYISDPNYGDPVSLLDDVLAIVKAGTKGNIWGRNHPMAQLDALYSHIMSKIPANVMADTRKLLILSLTKDWRGISLQFNCNLLGLTQSATYGATHHIRSVAIVPGPTEAAVNCLSFFHKSFPDYLRDFERSGFSPDIWFEAEQLVRQWALRILKEAPNGVFLAGASDDDVSFIGGTLKNRPRTRDNISVSWPAVRSRHNRKIRFGLYRFAVGWAMDMFSGREEAFRSLFCLRVLTTCFTELPRGFPFDAVRDFTFDKSRRRELLEDGMLKQVPLEALDYDAIMTRHCIRLRFRGPTIEHSNTWNVSCQHRRDGSWDDHSQEWSTEFRRPGGYKPRYKCHYCFERFTSHLRKLLPDHPVIVLDLTPTLRWVELQFVDMDDGVSDWLYHFFIEEEDKDDTRGRDDESEED